MQLLIESVLCYFNSRHIQDPASQRLTWSKPPLNVLVIRKVRDEGLLEPFKELCRFLVEVGDKDHLQNSHRNTIQHLLLIHCVKYSAR